MAAALSLEDGDAAGDRVGDAYPELEPASRAVPVLWWDEPLLAHHGGNIDPAPRGLVVAPPRLELEEPPRDDRRRRLARGFPQAKVSPRAVHPCGLGHF